MLVAVKFDRNDRINKTLKACLPTSTTSNLSPGTCCHIYVKSIVDKVALEASSIARTAAVNSYQGPTPTANPMHADAAVVEVTTMQRKFCSSCGHVIIGGGKFCPSCGAASV